MHKIQADFYRCWYLPPNDITCSDNRSNSRKLSNILQQEGIYHPHTSPIHTLSPKWIVSEFDAFDAERTIELIQQKHFWSSLNWTLFLRESYKNVPQNWRPTFLRSSISWWVQALFLSTLKCHLLLNFEKAYLKQDECQQLSSSLKLVSVISKLFQFTVGVLPEQNDLMPHNQSANHQHYSTESALMVVFLVIIQVLDSGNVALLSLLDLFAAFDCLDHYNVSGYLMDWIHACLTGYPPIREGSHNTSTTVLNLLSLRSLNMECFRDPFSVHCCSYFILLTLTKSSSRMASHLTSTPMI